MSEYWRVIIFPLSKVQAEAIVNAHNRKKNQGLICEAQKYNPDEIHIIGG